MKKMRKAMGFVLAGSMALMMAACGSLGAGNSDGGENNSGGG